MAPAKLPSSVVPRQGVRKQSSTDATQNMAAKSSVAALLGVAAALRGRRSKALPRRALTEEEIEDLDSDRGNEIPFEIRGFPLSQVFTGIGLGLTVFSFFDYFVFGTSGTGIGGLLFIYAIPALLIGLALIYTELKPVEVETDPDAVGLFDEKATRTLLKVKRDVTRYRYGDDAHLDNSLKALGLTAPVGSAGKRYPDLTNIIESRSPDGELEFKLLFDSKCLPFTVWSDPAKLATFDRFFGPGVWAEVIKHDPEKRIAMLKLTTGPRPSDKAIKPTEIKEDKEVTDA